MLVIVGESASGKSTLQNMLIESDGFERIVTYTTRPIRNGEKDGVSYHYITKEEFFDLKEKGFFVETAEYNGWFYGTPLNECKNKNSIVVLTPAGLRALKRANIELFSIYLKTDRRSRLIKILKRGDNIEEAYRRNVSDVGQFDAIELEVDCVIENNEYEKTPKEILAEAENEIAKALITPLLKRDKYE